MQGSTYGNGDELGNGIISFRGTYCNNGKANQLIWIRIDFGKRLWVVRVVVYVLKEDQFMERFAVKVGGTDLKKAKYCANNIDLYPGESLEVKHGRTVDRRDVYCHGPLEGQSVYFSKYTDYTDSKYTNTDYDQIRISEAFAEKMYRTTING